MKAVSLFTGLGILDHAAELLLNAQVVDQVEIDTDLHPHLRYYFPNANLFTDVREYRPTDQADILFGGFPCQDISRANTKAEGIEGTRSGLWSEMYRIAGILRPRIIIIENVPDLTFRGLDKVLSDLAEIGYDAEWELISAQAFGLPHRRTRLFVVAYPNSIRRIHDDQIFAPESCKQLQREIRASFMRAGSKINWPTPAPELLYHNDGAYPKRDAARVRAVGNSITPPQAIFIMGLVYRFLNL